MKSAPEDFLIEHLNLELNPDRPGELRIAKLQLPSGRSWASVTAQTSYANRNLLLANLTLDEQSRFKVVSLDASKIDAKKLDVGIEGTFAGAQINGTVALGEAEKSLETKLNFVLEDTSLEAVTKYLEPPKMEEGRIVQEPKVDVTKPEAPGATGIVKRLAVTASGQLDKPISWSGAVSGEINNLSAGGVVLDSVLIDATAAQGQAKIARLELNRGQNKITLEGDATLPQRTEEFGRVPASFQLRASVPDLASLTAGMAQPISGPAEVNGQINVRDATIHVDLAAVAGPVQFAQGSVERAVLRVRAAKQMPPPMPDEEKVGHETIAPPIWTNLTSEIGLEVTRVQFTDYAVDTVTAQVRSAEKIVTLEQLLAVRAENRITARGTYELPLDFAKAATQPGAIEVSVAAPQVGAFWIDDVDPSKKVSGSLQLDAQTALGEKLNNGSFNLYGTKISARNLTIPQVSAQGTIAQSIVYLNDLTASLNERDYINANGSAEIDPPHRYSGRLQTNIADLSRLEPILAAAGKETKLGGELVIDWQGNGQLEGFKNNGDLKLRLERGRFAEMRNLEANIDANYSPEELNVPIIYAASDKMIVQAIMQAKGSTLEVTKIQLDQGQAKYASGYISVPFVWSNLGTDRPIIPSDGKVLVNFQTENLDIQKLAKDFGAKAPVSGTANVKVDAQGTVQDLRASLDLQLTGLRSEELKEFTSATFVLNARVENNELNVNGRLEQSRIQPVVITANLPLPVARIIEEKKLDENTPVRARVQMSRSSINFAREFVPAIARIDGNLALDVNVGGTIAKPVLSGTAETTINSARMSNASIPPLTNFNARLVFADDRLSFSQCRGELSGGTFNVSGAITFPKLTDPNFDLALTAQQALVARNEDLTARADANLRVVGPLTSASVTGEVAITNSQFFKNIDLIPIGLPGRPAPAPKPPEDKPDLSFPNPPLRDWKFDISVKTKDAFRIRGNLAHGGALVDMKVTGTGLKPQLEGSVRLENVEATLPFSRLEINQGFLYFNPSDPMNPGLDLQGTSLIRDYTVHVYVYGTANQPEAVFTSEPPLPQEEIISLLATGTTREELLSGNNVLAGRAVMLLGQQLYRKIFKKGQSTKPNPVFDNLDLDVGNVDPRTGQQTATARYRVNEKVQVIGEIGVQGDFRGTVRYLVRFR